MASFVTQIEGDTMLLIEAETTGTFGKTVDEVRANPMAAFDNVLTNAAVISRVMSHRMRLELAGTPAKSAEIGFGMKVDQAGNVLIAREAERAQFSIRLIVKVD